MKNSKKEIIIYSLIVYIILLFFLLPYLYLLFLSFKSSSDIQAFPPRIFAPFTIENYIRIFKEIDIFFYIKNSAIVASACAIISILLALPATYSFTRFKFRGKGGFSFFFLAIQMAPVVALVYPIVILANKWGIFDELIAVIIFYLPFNTGFAIWLLKPFFESTRVELEDAAFVDGCNRLKAFLWITLPTLAPGIFVSTIFIFFGAWSEFVLALFLTSLHSKTLPTITLYFISYGNMEWGPMFAACAIGTLPIVIFGIFIRKYYLSVETGGAIKE